jgi:hypothetical protein
VNHFVVHFFSHHPQDAVNSTFSASDYTREMNRISNGENWPDIEHGTEAGGYLGNAPGTIDVLYGVQEGNGIHPVSHFQGCTGYFGQVLSFACGAGRRQSNESLSRSSRVRVHDFNFSIRVFVLDDFFGLAGNAINGAEFNGNGHADDVSGNLPGLAESIEAVFGGRSRRFEGVRVLEEQLICLRGGNIEPVFI